MRRTHISNVCESVPQYGTIADIGAFYFDQSLPAIEDLTITVSGDSIILNWSEVAGAEIYHIYRAEEPYFAITGMTPIADVTENQYIDEGVLYEGVYFYVVTYDTVSNAQ